MQSQTREVAQTAQEQARSAMHQVMDDARDRMEQEAEKFAGTLHNAGSQMRSMAEATDQPGVASSIVREGANAAERLASRLDEGGVERVLADVRSFARRNPGAFLFGAAAAGFVAGRMIRNFSNESNAGGVTYPDYQSEYGVPGMPAMTGGAATTDMPMLGEQSALPYDATGGAL